MAAQPLHLAWYNPVEIHWGAGTFRDLKVSGPVVVLADRAALSADEEARLAALLGAHCKAWYWFTGGLASVPLAQKICAELWPVLRQSPDMEILAIGGGSTMDLAKVLRYRMDHGDVPVDQWRVNRVPEGAHRHPLTLVPTTAGTGSEVTRWATLWDTDIAEPAKISWSLAHGFAERAYVDPLLTLGCPARLTRDCALDTLAHALESLWNRNSSPLSEVMAIEAARLVLKNLPALLNAPGDIDLRSAIARASLLAGMAMSQTQTALAHALSYGLTLNEGVPHGEACAVWLPMAWELAAQASPHCAAQLSRVLEPPASDGVAALAHWLRALDIEPRDLRTSEEGRTVLSEEMRSARGKNFIGSALMANP